MANAAADSLGIVEIGYMVLPSNVPSNHGRAPNKTNHYIVKLPRALDLSNMSGKQFEVGLSEIAYPHSWDGSFEASRCMYEIALVDLRRTLKPARKMKACLPENVPIRNYLHVESLIKGLNERKPKRFVGSEKNIQQGDWVNEWKGEFRVKKQRAQIILCQGDAIELNRDLANALGFVKTVYFFSEGIELKRKCGTSLEEDNQAEFGKLQELGATKKKKRSGPVESPTSSPKRKTDSLVKRSVEIINGDGPATDQVRDQSGDQTVDVTSQVKGFSPTGTEHHEISTDTSTTKVAQRLQKTESSLGTTGERDTATNADTGGRFPIPDNEFYPPPGTDLHISLPTRESEQNRDDLQATAPSAQGVVASGQGEKVSELVKKSLPPIAQVPRFMIRAEKEPNLQFDRHNIFVYCNLVKSTFCGDNFYPLLRTLAVDADKRGKYVSKTFERIHYLPLTGDFFNEIEIDLRFEDGSPVKFLWGKVVCTLHFRERATKRI